MRKLLYVILLVLLHCFISPVSVCAGTFSLPDSLITDDNVYKYTFSDFEKAQQIMEQLRKQKSLPPFRLDVVEGDLYFNADKPDGTMKKLTDVSKLNALGWHHKIDIEEGVQKMIDWYNNN